MAEAVARDLYRNLVLKAEIGGKIFEPGKWDGSLACLIKNFLAHADQRYRKPDGRPTGEAANIRYALQHLVEFCPGMQAADFGPLKLKEVRHKMIIAQLARKVINQRVNIIRRMFRWAAGEQLVPATVWHGLLAVEGLRKGVPGVKESEPVESVPEKDVKAALPHMSPIVADMVRIQQLTGMRSGELVTLQPGDIDRKKSIWIYRPGSHKTEHHDHKRAIALGPKAQEILRKYLDRPAGVFCFSPAQADKQRRKALHEGRQTPAGQGNEPGTNVKESPKKRPGEAYTPQSYGRAVDYACKAAKVPHWHPHQLRHSAATRLRQEFKGKGLDVARAVLGHRSLGMADHYAELDLALAIEAAKKIG
ncbi:MAG: tyrosine-type recombinase/integrase [Planctomycetes bacterium]|nr:tyrosine-type recombinase/integrase [Planctomycetota bacterium]